MFDETYDTVSVAIKPEPLAVVSTFKDPVTMDIPLLADPGSSVHEAYGIVGIYHFHRRDMYFPATLLIDKQSKLRWLHVGKRNSDRPVVEEIILELEKLEAE